MFFGQRAQTNHQSAETQPASARQESPRQRSEPLALLLHLQRTAGNQAVSRALQGGPACHPGLLLQRPVGHEEREEYSKERLGLQTNLTVNEPGDVYEREADRIADQVMATPAHPAVSGAPLHIQRLAEQPTGQAAPSSVDQALASPGRPLEPALRQDMEQRFGHDFSRVRVHTGAAAEQSARDVNAHAYTVGHDIVFAKGRFAPGTHKGRRLIAHELAHVAQNQSGDEANVVRRSNGFDEDEPTLVEGRNPNVRDPEGGFRGHVERGGERIPGNVAEGEIVTETPRPTSGGGGGAKSTKITSAIESVTELGKVGPLDAALFYLQIHAAHFAALENVSQRVEIAKDLLDHVTEFENGARELRKGVNALQRAEAALPEVTKFLETGTSFAVSIDELEYIEAYANSAGNLVSKAFDARVKLNNIIAGWDAVVAQAEKTRDFTRKAVMEATQILDFRFEKERGGSFRSFLIEARDDAGRVETWARSKWNSAKEILDTANLPVQRALQELASIRKELMTMAKGGGASAGVLVAIDYLKAAQRANDPAVALDAVTRSLDILHGISGVGHVVGRLWFLQRKLEGLSSD
jgi:hypothetical protein